jgi:hypothetical protein
MVIGETLLCALEPIGDGAGGSIGRVFGVAFGCGYGVGLVVFGGVGGVSRVRFGIEV